MCSEHRTDHSVDIVDSVETVVLSRNNNIRKYVTSEINVSYQGPTISPVLASDSYSEWSLCVAITLIITVLYTISIYRSLKCRKSREKQVALISFFYPDSLFSISLRQYALFRTQVRIIRNCSATIELFGTFRRNDLVTRAYDILTREHGL